MVTHNRNGFYIPDDDVNWAMWWSRGRFDKEKALDMIEFFWNRESCGIASDGFFAKSYIDWLNETPKFRTFLNNWIKEQREKEEL